MTANELVITEIESGTGKETQRGALLIVQYEGFLEDGKKFDSSHDRGKPFQFVFGTGRVIKGWDLGLINMREGGKRRLFNFMELIFNDFRSLFFFYDSHLTSVSLLKDN